jgi:hypothetical protein
LYTYLGHVNGETVKLAYVGLDGSGNSISTEQESMKSFGGLIDGFQFVDVAVDWGLWVDGEAKQARVCKFVTGPDKSVAPQRGGSVMQPVAIVYRIPVGISPSFVPLP